jgi:hypothetical protein
LLPTDIIYWHRKLTAQLHDFITYQSD